MSWPACDDERSDRDPSPGGDQNPGGDPFPAEELPPPPRPLSWRGLHPSERWLWFEQLWDEVCMLGERYRLALRSGWWEDEVQLEALAALAAWVDRYDSGEWDDPQGKLALLHDLGRVGALLRDGADPFQPERDRPRYLHHLIALGCRPPAGAR